jgi:hypothetical protein
MAEISFAGFQAWQSMLLSGNTTTNASRYKFRFHQAETGSDRGRPSIKDTTRIVLSVVAAATLKSECCCSPLGRHRWLIQKCSLWQPAPSRGRLEVALCHARGVALRMLGRSGCRT